MSAILMTRSVVNDMNHVDNLISRGDWRKAGNLIDKILPYYFRKRNESWDMSAMNTWLRNKYDFISTH